METSTKIGIALGVTAGVAILYLTKDKWMAWFEGDKPAPAPAPAPKTASGGIKSAAKTKSADGVDEETESAIEYDEQYDSFNAAGAGARPVHGTAKPKLPRWLRGFGGRPGTNHGDGQYGGVGVGIPISDVRTKKNITLMADGTMEAIMKLKPCEYDYKTTEYPSLPTGKQNGLIAQELKKVAPHLVYEMEIEGNEKVLAINYQGVIPFLIKGMQEQQRELNELKAKLN